ncbi:Putative zn(2)Cys(6) fungal-type DNA-binding domain, fungal transcription factor [Colletotrichum destructivum]|uniref:Zn(2)Cys(6) fungal-type DNA-binding domain, fungal transcription factor n=1 Tax=Colletotrichum destructivum TaxID=34406 RepID=A0AAX4IRX5_9PEZI|nr:Putative zn(2)Cys(6) fungal-type DNA-binding domain, fungal transcription factor [Colletotrichum destructivum]
MRARRGCWTCAARKIRCDGGLPTCKNCDKARRDCQGYGMRLSWPRDNDERRAMTGSNAPLAVVSSTRSSHQPADLFFVNTTWRDMELYGYLSGQMHASRLLPSSPSLWGPPQQQNVSHMDLVHYFQETAHLSLVTFGQSPLRIRDALLSMALAHNAVPGLALLQALLAFSSLHRHGPSEQASRFKIQALRSLSASVADEPLTPAKAAHQVAASMLLGAFEILQPSEGSGEWLWHTWGAMDTIQATARLMDQPHESDVGHLLNWVYYHETLSRFAVHHWRHKSLVPGTSPRSHGQRDLRYPPLARHRPNLPPVNPTHAILNLLSEICDTLVDPRDPRSRDREYQDRLEGFRRRIGDAPAPSAPTTDAAIAVELYRMATRIYLARASQSPWEAPADLDPLIDAVFSGSAVGSCTCEHFFPLLILACEARRDEQRAAIVGLIERTRRDARIRSIQGVKDTIQAIWVQQDLHRDDDVLVDYLGVLSAVISSGGTLLSFA